MIKSLISFSLTCTLIFSFTGCVGAPKTAELDIEKPIQTIETHGNNYLYAQDDVQLETKFMRDMINVNDEWIGDIKKSNRAYVGALSTYFLSVVGLIGCLAVDSDKSSTQAAWCGSSVGLALITIPLARRGNKYRHKVVKSYNDEFKQP